MFDISTISNIGGREINQDYLSFYTKDDDFILIVCDGLGSYYGSDVVSKFTAEHIISQIKKAFKNKDCDLTTLHTAIVKTYNEIAKNKENKPELESSCTTLAIAMKFNKQTYFAHIGDTRIYLFTENQPAFITKDHSLAYVAMENGEITFDQIPTHPHQNKLTKVFGSGYFVQPDYATFPHDLTSNECLLLATDGFWEYVYNDDLTEILSSTTTSQQALDKMVELINQRKSQFNDNYSAILLRINED